MKKRSASKGFSPGRPRRRANMRRRIGIGNESRFTCLGFVFWCTDQIVAAPCLKMASGNGTRSSFTHLDCEGICNEIPYLHYSTFVASDFDDTNEQKLQELDAFAHLMQQPDENFAQLQTIWETNHEFRLLQGSLI